MKTRVIVLVTLTMIVSLMVSLAACTSPSNSKTGMRVLCAGSLMVPFLEMEKEFEALHPDVDVLIEGHGSIQVIRHVTELYEEADVLAVADHSLIPMMMYNVQVPETAEIYTDWYIEFATNSLGLAYTSQSLYTDEIDSSNWYEIISRPDVKVGISDPRLDSCGYRTLMVCQLAELYFEDESIMDGITGGFSPPVTVDGDNGVYSVSVPEIVAPQKAVLRGSSMRLLAILESGDIDYAFMYKSMAEQYGLGFLELPSEINLGSDGYKELVEELKVTLSFQRFASVNPEFSCQPIVYGITIPQNAPHPELAMELVQFIMGPEGQRILQDAHQPLTVPLRIDNPDNLPGELVFLTEQGSNY